MRISGIRPTSLFDGVGINYVIFTQGCGHHCPHCHNESTWDFGGGYEVSTDEIIKGISKYLGFINGVTFSGGDPVYQLEDVIKIAKWAHKNGLKTTLYTGFDLKSLLSTSISLECIDYIMDGKYEHSKNTTELPFRGSSNQKMYVQTKPRLFKEVVYER